MFGLGLIGAQVVACARAKGHQVVGAVDSDPEKVGRDLSLIVEGVQGGVIVVADIEQIEAPADIVLHATGSSLGQVAGQFRRCINAGLSIVSTCEELAYPWRARRELAQELDHLCRNKSVALVGTGVNPGFAMDTLALVATAPCWLVRAVRIERVLDAASRRLSLQRKVGVGLALDDFDRGIQEGALGHVGLEDSAWMVADYLGLGVLAATTTVKPIVADRDVDLPSGELIARGRVLGLHHVVVLNDSADREVVRLDLTMAVGVENPHDMVDIEADPPVRFVVPGGLPGDASTAAIVVNTAGHLSGRSGLLTTAQLPPAFASPAPPI